VTARAAARRWEAYRHFGRICQPGRIKSLMDMGAVGGELKAVSFGTILMPKREGVLE
jgi:hypothetical protein